MSALSSRGLTFKLLHLGVMLSLQRLPAPHHASIAAFASTAPYETAPMPTLTVRNLDAHLVRRLRIRAAEHGRSAEAEHREILRAALLDTQRASNRQQAIDRLAEFRARIAGRGSPSATDLLEQSRAERMQALTGPGEGA